MVRMLAAWNTRDRFVDVRDPAPNHAQHKIELAHVGAE